MLCCAGCGGRQIEVSAGSGTDAGGASDAGTIEVKARLSAGCAVVANVDVACPGALTVTIDYGETPAYGMKTPAYPVDGDGHVSVPLLGLTKEKLNHFRVTAASASGGAIVSKDYLIAGGTLPAKFPRFVVKKRTGPADGYLVMGITDAWGAEAKAVIVSREGRLMWYRVMEKMTPHGLQVERLPNGHIAVYMGEDAGFDEVDISGTTLHTWSDTVAERGTNGHEFRMLAGGNALLLGFGGYTGSDNFDYIDEIDATGAGHFHWAGPAMPSENDVYHANSLDPIPDGAVLLSLRNTSEVLKIDMATGKTIWTLGGDTSDFTFVNDPLKGSSQQHHVRRLPNGNITMFDNGVMRNTPESRAVEYRLDEAARTATLVWENRHDPAVFCPIAGSVQRLDNGNTIVCWGASKLDTGALSITEVDPAGDVVWEMQSPGWGAYRAQWVPELYP